MTRDVMPRLGWYPTSTFSAAWGVPWVESVQRIFWRCWGTMSSDRAELRETLVGLLFGSFVCAVWYLDVFRCFRWSQKKATERELMTGFEEFLWWPSAAEWSETIAPARFSLESDGLQVLPFLPLDHDTCCTTVWSSIARVCHFRTLSAQDKIVWVVHTHTHQNQNQIDFVRL